MTTNINPLSFSDTEAALYVGMSRSYFRNSRCQGNPDAPPFIRIGRSIRYLKSDLDQWIESRRRFNNTLQA